MVSKEKEAVTLAGSLNKLNIEDILLITNVKNTINDQVLEFRRSEFVGPTISKELFPGMIQQVSTPCLKCEAKGYICQLNSKCNTCNNGLICKKDKYKINISPGSVNNQIIIEDKGDYNPELKKYNNLVINFEEIKHHNYIRKKNDLYTTQSINLKDALLGSL